MTAAGQAALLQGTADAPRDHVLYSMALGTGLRLRGLPGLNVGDVSPDGQGVRCRVTQNGQTLDSDSPLFVSGQGRRLSPRAAPWRFAWWQARAGFDRRYNFRALRHSAVTNVYRATRDLFLAQRFARHASPLTTAICTHPADEELAEGVRDLPC